MPDPMFDAAVAVFDSAFNYGIQKIGALWMLFCFALMALQTWLKSLKNLQAVRDTPTSQIATAAQGYTELSGTAKTFGNPLKSKLCENTCIWYAYKIEERRTDSDGKHHWVTVEEAMSDHKIILEDGTGRCIIDPTGADIKTSNEQCWTEAGKRYTEWIIMDDEPLYVLGNFHTQHKRVGSLGLQERELAANFMLNPADGRRYLIRNYPERLILEKESISSKRGLWIFLALLLLIWLLHLFWDTSTQFSN